MGLDNYPDDRGEPTGAPDPVDVEMDANPRPKTLGAWKRFRRGCIVGFPVATVVAGIVTLYLQSAQQIAADVHRSSPVLVGFSAENDAESGGSDPAAAYRVARADALDMLDVFVRQLELMEQRDFFGHWLGGANRRQLLIAELKEIRKVIGDSDEHPDDKLVIDWTAHAMHAVHQDFGAEVDGGFTGKPDDKVSAHVSAAAKSQLRWFSANLQELKSCMEDIVGKTPTETSSWRTAIESAERVCRGSRRAFLTQLMLWAAQIKDGGMADIEPFSKLQMDADQQIELLISALESHEVGIPNEIERLGKFRASIERRTKATSLLTQDPAAAMKLLTDGLQLKPYDERDPA